MVFEEMMRLFIASRKHGNSGARAKARPATIALYEHWLGYFFAFQRERGLTNYQQIKKVDIMAFLEWMDSEEGKKTPWAEATKLKVLRCLRAFFRFASLDEDCQDADGRQYKDWGRVLGVINRGKRRDYIPTYPEIRRFRAAFNTKNRWGHRDYVAFCLLLATGMRIGELCGLLLEHVKLEERVIYIRDGKTGSRLVPITLDMAKLLKSWLKVRLKCSSANDSPYLFVGKYDPKCNPRVFQKAFKKVGRKAGVTKLTPHTLRHAFCTYYLQNGGSIDKLRHIVGHKDFRMVLEYEHLAQVGGGAIRQELEKACPLTHVA